MVEDQYGFWLENRLGWGSGGEEWKQRNQSAVQVRDGIILD